MGSKPFWLISIYCSRLTAELQLFPRLTFKLGIFDPVKNIKQQICGKIGFSPYGLWHIGSKVSGTNLCTNINW
jgi:hypothetical protein